MRIYHIATAADWKQAKAAGDYTTSTRGRTLAEEGFVHAARREQVQQVFARYYRDAGEPLVLLTIETERLDVPWREERVGEETYPHIHGPIPARAVVTVQPLDRRGGTESFSAMFYRQMMLRAALGIGVMLLGVLGATLFGMAVPSWQALVGAAFGLLVGIVLSVVVLRRLDR